MTIALVNMQPRGFSRIENANESKYQCWQFSFECWSHSTNAMKFYTMHASRIHGMRENFPTWMYKFHKHLEQFFRILTFSAYFG